VLVGALLFLSSCQTVGKPTQTARTDTRSGTTSGNAEHDRGTERTTLGDLFKGIDFGEWEETLNIVLPVLGIGIVLLLFGIAFRNARKKRRRR